MRCSRKKGGREWLLEVGEWAAPCCKENSNKGEEKEDSYNLHRLSSRH